MLALTLLTQATAVGIEVDPERHSRAMAALREATASQLLEKDEVARAELREADATVDGTLPHETTFAYVSNLCFGPQLSRAIAARLASLPNLHSVAALKELELPPAPEGLDAPPCHLVKQRTIRVSTSWDEHARLHMYTRSCASNGTVPMPA